MYSRRFFLQSTAATLSWASIQPTFALESRIQCLQLSSERACADISAFQRRPQPVIEDHVTTPLLANDVSNLAHYLKTESIDVVYGLGTGADEFIVQQLIAEMTSAFPAIKVLSGRHQYLRDRVTHQLVGEHRLIDSLAAALKSSGPRWPSTLNAAMLAGIDQIHLNDEIDRMVEKSIHGKLTAPLDSPRLLHCWLFMRDLRS